MYKSKKCKSEENGNQMCRTLSVKFMKLMIKI